MTAVRHLIVPAAGLGTRLRPLTNTQSKEMLPLGGQPTLYGALLEGVSSGVERVTVVVHPRKRDLVAWLEEQGGHWPFELDTVVQPEPAGALDAVRRGRAGALEPCAILYPDMLTPNQDGLRTIIAMHESTGACVLGAQQVTPSNLGTIGRTGRFTFADGNPHRCNGNVTRIEAAPRAVGAWHSVFAEVRTVAFFDVEDELGGGDERAADIYNRVAGDGRLYAADLSANDARADVIDTGTMAGYRDAVARFDDRRWRWSDGGNGKGTVLAESQRRRGFGGEVGLLGEGGSSGSGGGDG